MMLLPPNERESGRDYAFRMLARNILSCALAPGSMVSENELAQKLKLSRTPVREAIIDLSRVGMVEVLPQRGSRIAYIDPERVQEAQFTRQALDQAACWHVFHHLQSDGLKRLRQNLLLQRSAVDDDDCVGFLTMDAAFHRELYDQAGMSHTYELFRGFMLHYDRVRYLSTEKVDLHVPYGDHCRMVEALADRDLETLQQVAHSHFTRFNPDLETFQRHFPAYFRP